MSKLWNLTIGCLAQSLCISHVVHFLTERERLADICAHAGLCTHEESMDRIAGFINRAHKETKACLSVKSLGGTTLPTKALSSIRHRNAIEI